MKLAWLVVAAATCIPALAASAADAGAADAEYAIRWDPAEGGPRSVDAIASALGRPTRKASSFEVRYFTLAQAAAPGEGLAPIARERTSRGKTQSTYKQRSAAPLPADSMQGGWQCPLGGRVLQSKQEVDIGWTADGPGARKYSLSCDAEGRLAELLPPRFMPKPSGCGGRFERVHAGPFKIEQWQLPHGRRIFEVSFNGTDSAAALETFRVQAVAPLLARGARPLAESKTELGSEC